MTNYFPWIKEKYYSYNKETAGKVVNEYINGNENQDINISNNNSNTYYSETPIYVSDKELSDLFIYNKLKLKEQYQNKFLNISWTVGSVWEDIYWIYWEWVEYVQIWIW